MVTVWPTRADMSKGNIEPGVLVSLINREITGKDLLQSLDLTFGT